MPLDIHVWIVLINALTYRHVKWHRIQRSFDSWLLNRSILMNIGLTVFDLISGLFAYVIMGKKTRPIYRTPLHFVFCSVSVHYAICFIFYVLCLHLSRVQNATYEDRCMWGKEGRKEGRKSLFWQVYIIQDDRYNTILSAYRHLQWQVQRSFDTWCKPSDTNED